jgi:hypothetical protein
VFSQTAHSISYLSLSLLWHEPVKDVVEDNHVGGGDDVRHGGELGARNRDSVAEAKMLRGRLSNLNKVLKE